jgi:hypothetical protein
MSETSTRRRDDRILAAATVVWLAVVVLLVAPALRLPADVDRIAIENPHAWPVHVEVSGAAAGADGWLGVGAVDPDHENGFQSVVDQGDVWVFRFSYAGHHAELRVTRRELAADDWRLTVPDDFARQMGDAGLSEAPG